MSLQPPPARCPQNNILKQFSIMTKPTVTETHDVKQNSKTNFTTSTHTAFFLDSQTGGGITWLHCNQNFGTKSTHPSVKVTVVWLSLEEAILQFYSPWWLYNI